MRQLNNTEKIEAIEAYQGRGDVHPLTCSGGGGPGDHQTLMEPWAIERAGEVRVILQCPDCGYIQENVPDYVYEVIEQMNQISAMVLQAGRQRAEYEMLVTKHTSTGGDTVYLGNLYYRDPEDKCMKKVHGYWVTGSDLMEVYEQYVELMSRKGDPSWTGKEDSEIDTIS